MRGKCEGWSAVLVVVVGCVLFGLCDATYEHKSFLCDDIEAICAFNSYGVANGTECGENERAFLNPAVCNCGSMCIKNLEEGEFCLTASALTYPSAMCGPGLDCMLEDPSDTKSAKCTRNPYKACVNESLQYEAAQKMGILGPGAHKPNCDEYGSYSPRQCSPGSTCYCVNEQGKRLFGEGIYTQESEMNCTCSVYWEDTLNSGLSLGMRCLPNGNFDSLQCLYSYYCFCYDEVTDSVTYGPVAVDMVPFMPCYNPEIHYVDFDNPCTRAQKARDMQGTDADVIVAETPRPVCSPDGYFASVQYKNGMAYCADMYGNPIENYERPIHKANEMNCHCPRRRQMMEDNGFGSSKPKCCDKGRDNGRYYPWQTRGPHAYCVDDNGNQYGDTVTITNIKDLSCYTDDPCPSSN